MVYIGVVKSFCIHSLQLQIMVHALQWHKLCIILLLPSISTISAIKHLELFFSAGESVNGLHHAAGASCLGCLRGKCTGFCISRLSGRIHYMSLYLLQACVCQHDVSARNYIIHYILTWGNVTHHLCLIKRTMLSSLILCYLRFLL